MTVEKLLVEWVETYKITLTNKKIISFGVDNILKLVTPSRYHCVDQNKNTVSEFNKAHSKNKFYTSSICSSPNHIRKVYSDGWSIFWSCNKLQDIELENLETYISAFSQLSPICVVSVQYSEEKPVELYLNEFRKFYIIENYNIKPNINSLFIYARQKNLRYKSLFSNIAVVGNCNNEIGKRNRCKIDLFKNVARMNNYILNDDYIKDYGSKQNYWVTSFNGDIDDRDISIYDKIFCPVPIYNYSMKYYKNRNTELLDQCKDKLYIIPLDFFIDLTKYVPNPSTGLAFLYWLYREHGELNINQVFGFSFFNPSFKHHYFDDFNLCYHDGDIEKEFFNKMISGEIEK